MTAFSVFPEKQAPPPIVVDSDADIYRYAIGGKARGLAQLTRLGAPVPPWCVVLPHTASWDDNTLQAHLQRIVETHFDIHAAPHITFAVRSSGKHEDGKNASYAGQYHSELHVLAHDLLPAIKRVREASNNENLKAYRQQQGTLEGQADTAPAIIIQAMVSGVPPEETLLAGVAFSHCPVTGNPNLQAVTYAIGRDGSDLMAGRCSGQTQYVDTQGQFIPSRNAPSPTPDSRHREAISSVLAWTRYLTQVMQQPVDIEWAASGGHVWLLQWRPITGLPLPEVLESWPREQTTWCNHTLLETWPGPCRPMTQALASRLIAQTYRGLISTSTCPKVPIIELDDMLESLVQGKRQRLYLNTSQLQTLWELCPSVNYRLSQWHALTTYWWETLQHDHLRIARTPHGTGWPGWHVLSHGADLLIEILEGKRNAKANYQQSLIMAPHLARQAQTLADELQHTPNLPQLDYLRSLTTHTLSLLEEHAFWTGVINGYWDVFVADDEQASILPPPEGFIRKLHNAYAQLQNAVEKHQPLIMLLSKEAEALSWLENEPQLSNAVKHYLMNYGARGPREAMCEVPVTQPVLTLLKQLCSSPPTQQGQASLDGQSESKRQKELAHALDHREQHRYTFSVLMQCLKQLAQRWGNALTHAGVLTQASDIYDLSWEELLDSLADGSEVPLHKHFSALIASRQQQTRDDAERPVPPDKFTTYGTEDWDERFGQSPSSKQETSHSSMHLQGHANGGGQARGELVWYDPKITTYTGQIVAIYAAEPHIVLILGDIAGLVTQVGSPLSHAAILAREWGVPSIMGISGLDQWETGTQVILDGSTGQLTRIAPQDTPPVETVYRVADTANQNPKATL